MRIDKYLCDTLNMTRSEAKKAIAAGNVTLNGEKIRSASVHVDGEEVLINGERVEYQRYFYIMLHKPKGYVCANSDRNEKTVFDLLPVEYRKKDLFVCGRLDKDTTGLVLLTNNGTLAHRLLAPKNDVYKEYYVSLRDTVTQADVDALKNGITLRDGTRCKSACFEADTSNSGVIRISEGKYHQIKRMFGALGNEVIALHRHSIHGLELDETLPLGKCRYLTDHEVISLENVE